MSRRPKDPGEIFSHADLAEAIGTTKRSIQHLMDTGLMDNFSQAQLLNRVAVIGGFQGAGVSALLAARAVNAVTLSFNYDEVPTGLKFMANKLSREEITSMKGIGDYWYHRSLIKRSDIYQPGTAYKGDVIIEVVDRRYLFISHFEGLPLISPNGKKYTREFVGWIDGWDRNSEATVTHISEKIDFSQPNDAWAQLEEDAQLIYRNATGKITVNASLAVRNALDRLHHYRFGSSREGKAIQ